MLHTKLQGMSSLRGSEGRYLKVQRSMSNTSIEVEWNEMNGIDVEIQRLRRGRKVGSGVALIDRGGTSMSCRDIANEWEDKVYSGYTILPDSTFSIWFGDRTLCQVLKRSISGTSRGLLPSGKIRALELTKLREISCSLLSSASGLYSALWEWWVLDSELVEL